MEGYIAVSPDGATWEAGGDITAIKNGVITFGNGRFVAAGSAGNIAYSDDSGLSWTYVEGRPFPSGDSGIIHSLCYGNGVFVAGGAGMLAWSSDDGATWTEAAKSEFRTRGIRAIVFCGGTFVAGGDNGKMESSFDGKTWWPVIDSAFPDDRTGTIYGIAGYDYDNFVAVGGYGNISYGQNR